MRRFIINNRILIKYLLLSLEIIITYLNEYENYLTTEKATYAGVYDYDIKILILYAP